MKNIQSTHATFEQSKWLKEKGFDVKTRGRIHVSHWHLVKNNIIPSNVNTFHNDMFAPIDNWNKDNTHYMSLPEQWQVVEWLRINHGIWVSVTINGLNKTFNYDIHCINKQQGSLDNIVICGYETPQEAYSAAFDYILKELI
jgi:hypothetical protein